eukprot:2771893-Rhodomonas_salina.1
MTRWRAEIQRREIQWRNPMAKSNGEIQWRNPMARKKDDKMMSVPDTSDTPQLQLCSHNSSRARQRGKKPETPGKQNRKRIAQGVIPGEM